MHYTCLCREFQHDSARSGEERRCPGGREANTASGMTCDAGPVEPQVVVYDQQSAFDRTVMTPPGCPWHVPGARLSRGRSQCCRRLRAVVA